MLRCLRHLVLLAALPGLACSVHAALEWKTKGVELRPALHAADAEAEFAFKNTGTTPVTITSVTTSCGCTVPALERKTFAPGESGVLRASYHIGERTGDQHSTITLQTDTPGEGFTVLELRLQIPEAIALDQRAVSWKLGDEPAAKRIVVRVHPDTGWKITGVTTSDAGWKAVLQPGSVANEYYVDLSPEKTDTRGRAIFTLSADSSAAPRVTLFAFVH